MLVISSNGFYIFKSHTTRYMSQQQFEQEQIKPPNPFTFIIWLVDQKWPEEQWGKKLSRESQQYDQWVATLRTFPTMQTEQLSIPSFSAKPPISLPEHKEPPAVKKLISQTQVKNQQGGSSSSELIVFENNQVISQPPPAPGPPQGPPQQNSCCCRRSNKKLTLFAGFGILIMLMILAQGGMLGFEYHQQRRIYAANEESLKNASLLLDTLSNSCQTAAVTVTTPKIVSNSSSPPPSRQKIVCNDSDPIQFQLSLVKEVLEFNHQVLLRANERGNTLFIMAYECGKTLTEGIKELIASIFLVFCSQKLKQLVTH